MHTIVPIVLLFWHWGLHGVAHGQTLPSDRDALLQVKNALDPAPIVFSEWTLDSDPCADNWRGIICDCTFGNNATRSQQWEPDANTSANCPIPSALPYRVINLDLGATAAGRVTLSGTISPAVGNLTALRYFNIQNNGRALTGPLPDTMTSLQNLTTILASNNGLNGTLPAWLPKLSSLQFLYLANNSFTGSIPPQWCAFQTTNVRVDISTNDLCGVVPSCVKWAIVTTVGTRLFDKQLTNTSTLSEEQVTNYCCTVGQGGGVPECDAANGCFVTVPVYWSSRESIDFNFTSFQGGGSELLGGLSPDEFTQRLQQYQWSIGTTIAKTALEWTSFTPKHGTLTVYAYATEDSRGRFGWTAYRNITTFPTVLENGQTYYGFVRVASDFCAGTVVVTQSNTSAQVVVAPPTPLTSVQVAQPVPWGPDGDAWQIDTQFSFFYDAVFNCSDPDQCSYTWQLFNETNNAVSPLIPLTKPNEDVSWPITFLYNTSVVKQGHPYLVVVSATSLANLTGTSSQWVTIPATISEGTSNIEVVAIAVGVCGGVLLVVMTTLLYLHMRRDRRRKQAKLRSERMHMLQQVLRSSSNGTMGSSGGRGGEGVLDDTAVYQRIITTGVKKGGGNVGAVAFVVTDLEHSTAMSNADGAAFKEVQILHDNLLRDNIERFGGYEVQTEGDSFVIAFSSVLAAVTFCTESQYDLLQLQWPAKVLQLPACKPVHRDGHLIFNGPRVRMGIHWAVEGTIAARQYEHWVFRGPGFELAQEVGDAGHGGQILLTHWAWDQLRSCMDTARFPCVRQLGLYCAASSAVPIWLYEVQQLLGRPLRRVFGPLTGLKQVHPGFGYQITPAPVPEREGAPLAFVTCRITSVDMHTATTTLTWLPPRVYALMGVVAEQFQGYMYQCQEQQMHYQLVFSTTLDALRFCITMQVVLLYEEWPQDALAVLGGTVVGLDNKVLFRGPRMAMALVLSDEYTEVQLPESDISLMTSAHWIDSTYHGHAPALASALVNIAHGGQTVCNEAAWKMLQDNLPGRCQSISLGCHIISDEYPDQYTLTEIQPLILARRNFPPLLSKRMVSPGYREAPDPSYRMAIVFIKVSKPEEVLAAQRMEEGLDDDTILHVLTAYLKGIGIVEDTLRTLLHTYSGYECKEPEPGKFTLAFSSLEHALGCCCRLQTALLSAPWPRRLLACAACQPVSAHPVHGSGYGDFSGANAAILETTGGLLWRGLRVRVGVAYGKVDHKKPLCTGRADYFGALPNLAARVCAMAKPGQVLVDGMGTSLLQVWPGKLALSKDTPPHELPRYIGTWPPNNNTVMLQCMGRFNLKGFERKRSLFDAHCWALRSRFANALPWPLEDMALVVDGHLRPQQTELLLQGGPFDWMHMSSIAATASKRMSRQQTGATDAPTNGGQGGGQIVVEPLRENSIMVGIGQSFVHLRNKLVTRRKDAGHDGRRSLHTSSQTSESTDPSVRRGGAHGRLWMNGSTESTLSSHALVEDPDDVLDVLPALASITARSNADSNSNSNSQRNGHEWSTMQSTMQSTDILRPSTNVQSSTTDHGTLDTDGQRSEEPLDTSRSVYSVELSLRGSLGALSEGGRTAAAVALAAAATAGDQGVGQHDRRGGQHTGGSKGWRRRRSVESLEGGASKQSSGDVGLRSLDSVMRIVRRMSSVGRSTHPTPATPPARAHQHDDIHTQAPLTFPTKSARHDTHTFTHNEDDDEGDDGDAVAAVLDSEGGNDAHGIKEQVQYEIKEHALVQHDKVDDHTIQQQQQQQQKQQQQLQPSKSTPQSDHTQPSSHQHQPTTAPESPQSPQPEPPQADTFDLSRVSLRTQDAYHTAATFVYGRQLSMRLSKPNLGRGQQFGQQPSTPTGSPYGTSPHAGWASGNTMSPATSLLPPMPPESLMSALTEDVLPTTNTTIATGTRSAPLTFPSHAQQAPGVYPPLPSSSPQTSLQPAGQSPAVQSPAHHRTIAHTPGGGASGPSMAAEGVRMGETWGVDTPFAAPAGRLQQGDIQHEGTNDGGNRVHGQVEMVNARENTMVKHGLTGGTLGGTLGATLGETLGCEGGSVYGGIQGVGGDDAQLQQQQQQQHQQVQVGAADQAAAVALHPKYMRNRHLIVNLTSLDTTTTQDPSVHAPPSPHTPPHPPPTPNDPRTRPHLLKRIKAYLKTAGRVAIRQQGHSIPGSLYCNDAAEFESFVSASSGGGLGGSGAGGSGIGGSIGGGSGGVVRGGNSSGALGTATSPVTPTSA